MTGTVMVGFAETMSSMQVYCKAEHLSKWHTVSVCKRAEMAPTPLLAVCATRRSVWPLASMLHALLDCGLRHHTATTSFSTL